MLHVFLLAGGAAIGLSVIAWLLSLLFKDASIADVFWGLYFIIIAGALYVGLPSHTRLQLIDLILLSIWGLRLAWHIGYRKIGAEEDWRYAENRKKWGNSFAVRSYFQNFFFQALLALVISASTLVIAYNLSYAIVKVGSLNGTHLLHIFAVGLWIIGFLFESIGDWQLSRWIKTKKKKGAIMTTGLWRYTRHPNYFGEVTQWWALWILCLGGTYSLFAVLSPLLITYLILFVSGVPMLEKKYMKNSKFKAYAKRTSIFIPMQPKGGK